MKRRDIIKLVPLAGISSVAHATQPIVMNASFGDAFSDLYTFQIGDMYYVSPIAGNVQTLTDWCFPNTQMQVKNNTSSGYMSIRHGNWNQQCVTLVRAFSNAGGSWLWRKGMHAIDLTHKVYYPVPIATFNTQGLYSPGHAAILLYVSEMGITVLDQNWDNVNGRIAVHMIPFLDSWGNYPQKSAYNYSVIEQ